MAAQTAPIIEENAETQRLKGMARDHLWMSYQPPVPYESEGGPRVIVAAEGTWMVDTEGRRYLDGVSALEACIAGHIRPELADVAYAQMQKLEFLDVFRYASPPAIELAARLAEITPGSLSRVHYTPGGSEAVETAIKMAKQYHMIVRGDKKRYKVITREGAYHGCTFGAMAVDGEYFGTQIHFYDPLPPFGRTSPPPYHYRCQHCSNEDACNLKCVDDIEAGDPAGGPGDGRCHHLRPLRHGQFRVGAARWLHAKGAGAV